MSQDTRGIRYGFRIVAGGLAVTATAITLIVLAVTRQ